MVQLSEDLPDDSIAKNAGYKTIPELAVDRLIKAGKYVKEETKADIDYGFRVYKLDESNMQDVYYKPQEYIQDSMD